MVTARQKALVETSWAKLRPVALQVSELFYDRLFELDPSLEELFKNDTAMQGAKLMRAVGALVDALQEPSWTSPMLHELGKRHLDYGVRPGHYVTFGEALLWTLEQSLGDDFTPAMKEAWHALYRLLSATMIEASVLSEPAGTEPASSIRRVGAPQRIRGAQ
jgi:hemoglobin-like flavoprotein